MSITNGINLSSLDGSNGFRLSDSWGGLSSFLGISVSDAGDVNGDGFDDVIIGAKHSTYGYAHGLSYVVFGKASGFDTTLDLFTNLDGKNGFRLSRAESSHPFIVSSAGDVNGDGFDDVIIGAKGAYDPSDYSTHYDTSYVVFGRASGFIADTSLSNLDGNDGFQLDVSGIRGISVSGAGDINGDGFDDVIVDGYQKVNPNTNYSGFSYVVFGKANGFNAKVNLSDLNGSNGFRLDGTGDHQSPFPSGTRVSAAGDVNGDGFDDLIVGAPDAGSNGERSGSSYVVFGKATGFNAKMNLSDLDGSNGFRLDGLIGGDQFGYSVSDAGDVNGDGFADLLVGAPYADNNGNISGSTYVVFGKANGFSAVLDLSSLDGSNGFRLDGVTTSDYSGASVSTAGDVNGDGFDDLIIGARFAEPRGDRSGASYVVFGKASGFSAAMDLSSLDSHNGIRLDGASDYLADFPSGNEVSTVGDVNGDGFDDLIVGALTDNHYSGSGYIIFGRSDFGRDIPEIVGTSRNDKLAGTKAAERFEAGAGNDRMIGRGGADIFNGDTGNDYIRIGDLGFQWIEGGAGIDTLGLGGKNLDLDLAIVGNKINGIEKINLYGTGDNTLTLTAEDVRHLSNTTDTLKVNGNAGDRVVGLGSDWNDGGIHHNFHTFTSGHAVLLVGINVTVDFSVV